MSRNILAVDIRNTTIAAVLLSTGLKSSVVRDCLFVPFNPNGNEADGLSQSLDALLQRFNSSGASIVVAIPADRAFYRTLQVPFKDENKIRQILPFELEPLLPINVDNLIIDFQKSAAHDPAHLLAVAIENKTLQYYLDIFRALDKQPQLVVPGIFPSLINLLHSPEGLPNHTALLDIEASKATLQVVHAGHPALVRTISSDMQSGNGMESLAVQIRQTLTAYADTTAAVEAPLQSVYVGGPAMRDASKRQALAAALPWSVEFIDLRKRLPKVEIDKSVEKYNPWLMDNALALALVEAENKNCLSFHRSRSLLRDFWTSYRSVIIGPAVMFSVVLLFALGNIMLENHLLKKQVDQIDTRMRAVFLSAFPDTRPLEDTLNHMKSKLKEAQAVAPAPLQDAVKVPSIVILYEISRLIPEEVDMHFSRMVIGPESISIAGSASAFNVVDDVKSRLEKSDKFKQVEISSATMDRTGQSVSFRYTIEL